MKQKAGIDTHLYIKKSIINTTLYVTNPYKSTSLPQVSLNGYVNIKGHNMHFKRQSTEWIMYIVESGHMIICEDDNTYSLSSGDVIIFTPGRTHWGKPLDSDINYYFVHFFWENLTEKTLTDEEYLSLTFKSHVSVSNLPSKDDKNNYPETDLFLIPKFSHLTPIVFGETINIFKRLINENKIAAYNFDSMENSLLHLILMYIQRSNSEIITQTNFQTTFLTDLITYLRNHYNEKITGNILEKELNRNFDYMNRIFHKSTGKTIFKYLLELRLEESKKLLRAGHLSIAEVADETGFCNAFYFSKVFKDYEGITPSRYMHSDFM